MADNVKTEENRQLDEKVELLKEMGKTDLIDLVREWSPKKAVNKKKSAPLDQRVSLVVGSKERRWLDREIAVLKKTEPKISMSQFIRNRSLGSVDINGWKELAEDELNKIENIFENQMEIRERERTLERILEGMSDDNEDTPRFERELSEIRSNLKKIVAQKQARKFRLSGRMSMAESETIKWRAQRLCISSSDYLRMMIFDLLPAGAGDAHMSYDAKRRFYISIIEVSRNGWGSPPEMYNCPQCENYLEEIRRLKNRVKQLEKFA